jgi:excisionase family DNA binding protein
VDDMDVIRAMAQDAQARWLADQPLMYTVEEAATLLRIGRSLAYELVQRFESSAGREGLPAVRVGHLWRVPRDVVLQIALGSRTVGTASQSGLVLAEQPRAARAGGVRVAGSGRSRRAGPSEQLLLLPPSD